MLIGELSKQTQLSRDTIRFYEKRGLIKALPSTSEFNTYKNYTEKNLSTLMWIKKAKGFGFTLNEIAELLELVDNNEANCSILREKVIDKVADIDMKIQELTNMKASINKRLQEAQISCKSVEEKSNCKQLNYE